MIRHMFKLIWHRKRANLLLMIEILCSFLVLFGVCALAVYFGTNWRTPIGFSVDHLWIVAVDTKGKGTAAEQSETMELVMAALRDLPQVENAAGVQLPPYAMATANDHDVVNGRRAEYGWNVVTDSYKDVLGLRVIEGRWFGREDDGSRDQPVVINAEMARALFPGESAVGRAIGAETDPAGKPIRPRRVVGVVEAYREDGEVDGQVYQVLMRGERVEPADGEAGSGRNGRTAAAAPPGNLIVRVRPGTTAAFEEALSNRLQGVARDWSFDVKPLAENRTTMLQFAFAPIAAIGLVAGFLLLMVALGLTGVLWQNVTQRTREIGLRRAKGADRGRVQRQILGELLVMTTFALIAGTVLVAQLPLISPFDWVGKRVYVTGFIMAASAMYLLTLACGWYPSRLATTIEPAEALRYE